MINSLGTNRIGFVHIPKTGGSSVIEAFKSKFGEDQCLSFNATITDHDFETKEFVAGHVYLGDVTAQARIFTFVRNPLSQIASHLLWLDHYTMPEFEVEARGFSHTIQNVFDAVRRVDFSSARSISNFLTEFQHHSEIRIANLQSEMLAFQRGFVERIDDAELARRSIKALDLLYFVGLTEHLDADLAQLFYLLGRSVELERMHINASPAVRQIDLAVPAIRNVLEARVGADLRLWEAVSARRERNLG